MPHIKLYYFKSDPDHKMDEKEFKEVASARISAAFNMHSEKQFLREFINRSSLMLLEFHPSRADRWRAMFSGKGTVMTTERAAFLADGKPANKTVGDIFNELQHRKAPASEFVQALKWAKGTIHELIINNLDQIAQDLINDLDERKVSVDMLRALFVWNEGHCERVLGSGPHSQLRAMDVIVDTVPAAAAAR
jgi:hypothetical protein